MAVETNTVAGVGDVTIDLTGDLVAKQSGGPAGAYHFEDDNGPVNVSVAGVGNGQVYAPRAKTEVDAIVTAFNA